MKKMLKFLAVIFAAVVISSCSSAKPDDSGWYNDYDAAKKIASKQNKNVLLFVNSVYDIDGSQNAVKLLLETPEFVNGLKDSYVCVHFDFTDIMNLNVIDENAKPEDVDPVVKDGNLLTNVYNRENIFYIDIVSAEFIYQLPLMPSLGLTLSF